MINKRCEIASKMHAALMYFLFVNSVVINLPSLSGVFSLKNVSLETVQAVKAGSWLHLQCNYDLENALLYSIKWYFGNDEFYRYVPKESPPTRVFPLPGIIVDISRSNDKEVTLNDVQRDLTGYYKCEVSADAPLFHTDIKSALVVVAEEPRLPPILTTDKPKYSVGELIGANCTSPSGYPAANVTWFINEKKVEEKLPSVEIINSVTKEFGGLETSRSRIEFFGSSHYFHNGRLKIKCQAGQFDLYSKHVEAKLEADTPQLAHVLSPSTKRNSSNRCAISYVGLLAITTATLLQRTLVFPAETR